ncbi:MAG: YciI family protein [Thermomicrobiales bacterium]
MKYILLIYLTEGSLSDQEMQACYGESAGVAQQMHTTGNYLAASPLLPVSTAVSVRIRDGKTTTTDGPFAETREQLGGYFVVEAESMEEAIKFAELIPGAKFGTVEVRPMLDVPGLPEL